MHRRRAGVISSDYWEYQPGEPVMTIDGLPGVVDEVQDGPVAGNENYIVTLDHGLGGGNYSSSMLAPLRRSTAAEVTATGIHLAAEDYPELGTIVQDRPDPGKLVFEAAKVVPSAERAAADAEDHDEEDPVAVDTSLSGAPASGEVADNPQPSSCSYCGGTEFEDLRDNGRVRQATCSTCKGTMSAHPGLQWSPELIGDSSNHPNMAVDPHSGASPAAGATGGISGINDSTYSDATRVGKLGAADDTCPTCKGKGTVTWHDVDPHWEGDLDDNPGIEHTDTCDDCEGKGRLPEPSEDDLAEQQRIRQERQEQQARAVARHLYHEHQGEKAAPTWENVKNCPRSCPVGREYGRNRAQQVHGSMNTTLLHIAGVPSLPERVASSETTALEAKMASEIDPLQVQRELDRASEEEHAKHQDDGKYAENYDPLHKSDLHPDRAAQFAFHHNTEEAHNPFKDLISDQPTWGVGPHEAPVHLTHYKSPMAMEPLHLDEHGNAWRRNYEWGHPNAKHPEWRGWSGPHSATETLDEHPTWSVSHDAEGNRQQHMRPHAEREQMANVLPGETHEELVQRRNKTLSDKGWSVLSAAGRIAEQMREKLGPGSANQDIQQVAMHREAAHLDLYHRTTPEAAEEIRQTRSMRSKENTGETYWSTFRGDEPDAQTGGYGHGVVHIRVPEHLAEIEDEFPSGEEHYRVHPHQLQPHHFVED